MHKAPRKKRYIYQKLLEYIAKIRPDLFIKRQSNLINHLTIIILLICIIYLSLIHIKDVKKKVISVNNTECNENYEFDDMDRLALLAGTDKSSAYHNYTGVYYKYFAPYRDKKIKFLGILFPSVFWVL